MNDVAKQKVVLPVPDENGIQIKPSVTLGTNQPKMDLYYPIGRSDAGWPVTLLVGGYPDSGFEQTMGCKFKDMVSLKCWAMLLASHGMVAVTYESENALEDLQGVIRTLAQNSDELGTDPNRIALWASSGNAPTALGAVANSEFNFRCAALCYGYLLDLPSHTDVAQAASKFHFANPMQGKSIQDIPQTPLMVVRAGADELPGLNDSMDRFIGAALNQNLPITLINYSAGVHAFDLWDNSLESQAVCQRVIDYLKHNLQPS